MQIRGIFSSIDISATGLAAQRRRMDAIAENIANVNTTRTPEGGPYKRRITVFSEARADVRTVQLKNDPVQKTQVSASDGSHLKSFARYMNDNRFSGVTNTEIRDDTTPEFIYDPAHPDANEFGYVAKPKINIITEMVEMISATRNYEANVAAIDASKSMAKRALEI